MNKSEFIALKYAELEQLAAQDGSWEHRRQIVQDVRQSGFALPTQEIGATITQYQEMLARPGVVVVGSIAFETYCSMRGLTGLPVSLVSTKDLDVGHASSSPAQPKHTEANDFVRLGTDGVKMDLLTPQTREQERRQDRPMVAYAPVLRSFARVMPGYFRELLLEAKPALLFHQAGIEINVPHPLRFAMHKLVISCERHSEEKIAKDRGQAAVILNEFCKGPDNRSDIAATFLGYNEQTQGKILESLDQVMPDLSRPAKDWLYAGMQQAQNKLTK